jgi:hypothetical protein
MYPQPPRMPPNAQRQREGNGPSIHFRGPPPPPHPTPPDMNNFIISSNPLRHNGTIINDL